MSLSPCTGHGKELWRLSRSFPLSASRSVSSNKVVDELVPQIFKEIVEMPVSTLCIVSCGEAIHSDLVRTSSTIHPHATSTSTSRSRIRFSSRSFPRFRLQIWCSLCGVSLSDVKKMSSQVIISNHICHYGPVASCWSGGSDSTLAPS